MTTQQRFERDLPELLTELYIGPTPDYRDDLLGQVAATRQRPAWTFPERWLPMGVTTLARQTIPPVPWRTIGLLAALVLLLLAAIAIYVGTNQPRLPAPFGPAANGQLAVAEDGDIFLLDPETGTKTLAIGGDGLDSLPTFSRDGTQLAFYRGPGTLGKLWLADARGGSPRPLSMAGLKAPNDIVWSPDGRSILVNATVGSGTVLAVVPTDGSEPRVLNVGMPAESPTWLPPSGDRIVFRGVGPDGFGLYTVRADGSDVQTLVRPIPTNADHQFDVLFVSPSPDGALIAYQWRGADGTQKVFVVPSVGGTPRAVTTIEAALIPGWSPDGRWIAFLSDADSFYTVPSDGSSGATLLTQSIPLEGATWTPDSRQLLVAREDGSVVLYDPSTGEGVEASWTAPSVPSWQRVAPTP